jgi:hypothetical protein
MRSGLILLAVLGSFGLSGCMNVNTLQVNSSPSKNPTKAFSKAKVLFADKMRDPEATRFKPNHTVYDLSNGDQVVCGTANAKNAMGGYVGYKPFYIRLRGDRVMASQYPNGIDARVVQAMATEIYQKCNEVASGTMMIMP